MPKDKVQELEETNRLLSPAINQGYSTLQFRDNIAYATLSKEYFAEGVGEYLEQLSMTNTLFQNLQVTLTQLDKLGWPLVVDFDNKKGKRP